MSNLKEWVINRKSDIGLVVLILYTLTLGVAAADEIFDLGMFPDKLDRMISESIDKFKSLDPAVREAGVNEIKEYGDFAVPQLIKSLDEDGQARELALECLNSITDKNFGSDVDAWKDWYDKHKKEF